MRVGRLTIMGLLEMIGGNDWRIFDAPYRIMAPDKLVRIFAHIGDFGDFETGNLWIWEMNDRP
jgi:hypothetical protein